MKQKDLRKGRHSQPGQIYCLTFTVSKREPLLSFETAPILARLLYKNAIVKDHTLLCWVIMPDHVHLLIQLGHKESLSTFVANLKGQSSRQINQALQRSGPFWQDGFYDHALRSEDDCKAFARYIVANPIRAGLVTSVRNYAFWHSAWL